MASAPSLEPPSGFISSYALASESAQRTHWFGVRAARGPLATLSGERDQPHGSRRVAPFIHDGMDSRGVCRAVARRGRVLVVES